ncbi:MAG: hypothetical protein HYT09_00705 [Candidatus Levybacteria bacterium]|nr:hypothetical protein [Candidatus Levybacteria bacterium]
MTFEQRDGQSPPVFGEGFLDYGQNLFDQDPFDQLVDSLARTCDVDLSSARQFIGRAAISLDDHDFYTFETIGEVARKIFDRRTVDVRLLVSHFHQGTRSLTEKPYWYRYLANSLGDSYEMDGSHRHNGSTHVLPIATYELWLKQNQATLPQVEMIWEPRVVRIIRRQNGTR